MHPIESQTQDQITTNTTVPELDSVEIFGTRWNRAECYTNIMIKSSITNVNFYMAEQRMPMPIEKIRPGKR